MKFFDLHSHTPPQDSQTLVIYNQYPLSASTQHYFSVGLHPWYLEDWQKQWEQMPFWANHPNCLAIGECGLDRNATADFSLQQEIFKKHIVLSEQLRKPLIIHCVKAYDTVISLKKAYAPQQLWVIHGFRKNHKTAQALIQAGIALSFGKALLFDASLQEIFKNLPPNTFFLETDDADISIKQLYQKAIEIRPNPNDFLNLGKPFCQF